MSAIIPAPRMPLASPQRIFGPDQKRADCSAKLETPDAQSDGPSAGGYLQRLAAAQPSLVNWRARATAKASAGTFLVMHEPAPM